MDDLREQFSREALPIDDDILAATVDEGGYQDCMFVRQLHLCNVGAKRILAAIREYFRAFEQRSRWLREDLVLVGELDRYERRLIEEWEIVFERIKDDLGEETAEEVKLRAAKKVYQWVEESVFRCGRASPSRSSLGAPSRCFRTGSGSVGIPSSWTVCSTF